MAEFNVIADKIRQQVSENHIILYMKGTPEQPKCGFSAKAVELLKQCGHTQFASVDVLANPEIRQTLPAVFNWPTFPQLYVNGELVGGCDIMTELFEAGELADVLAQVQE